LRSLREAAVKGAASGALTSGINYLADVTGPQPAARRSPGIQYQGGAAGMFRPRDPKRGCVPSDPSIGSLRYGRDYGYQYNVPVSGEESQNRRGFSLWNFGKEVVLGAVTGGMAGATFYGAGRAVRALKESIRGHYNTINPKNVNFMQSSIKNQTGEYTVLGNAEALKNGTLQVTDLPEMRIWKDSDGKLWTLDHRRLAAFRIAEADNVPFRWATNDEVAGQMWKMTTQTGGVSVKLKLGNGKSIIIR
ncbi:MAG: hypothetical protein OSJ60_23115, partial [Lachnospiraceae bacterium]|nr:hypothetical protein [Lachnospiraceae bacterium]